MTAPVAVVTGASRGIGKQLSIDLAEQGYRIVCVARSTSQSQGRLPGDIDETVALVRELGGEAVPVALDVRDEAAVSKLADQVYGEFGRCDLLINNAAVAPPLPALQDSTKRWRVGVDVNLNGPFYLMYYFCPRMPEGEGKVINISSGAAVTPEFGRPNYTATKLALEGLSQSLAHELRGKVAVNVLRLDLAVWSEGFSATLPKDVNYPFEHPVIMSDAVLWMAEQAIDYSGRVETITGLREKGIVRPEFLYKDQGPGTASRSSLRGRPE
ncbi:MAG: SDR family NAD(P)-dependent oxidoreductase [Myxococcota bacterium]|nr:SDR family NAD(P)-dependent oxidoreductase [Myxococcota bacterium]